MALLTWSSRFSVGVKRMDEQHTVLFRMLNDLHESMMKGQAKQIVGPLLRKLSAYTHEHFTAEEGLMAASGYAGLTQHRVLHRDLIKQVNEFAARYERGESTLNLQLLNFLGDWLSTHIQNEDQKYGPWMNEHGTR
jgi:hemerythrin